MQLNDSDRISQAVRSGLQGLRQAMFVLDSSFAGVDEARISTIGFATTLEKWMHLRSGSDWRPARWEQSIPFAESDWIGQLKYDSYTPGQGTWITAVVSVSASSDEASNVELYDREIFPLDDLGRIKPPFAYAVATTIRGELRQFPRTLENIPAWMLERLASEDLEVPLYNPELGTLDWDNRRWPVGPYGVEPNAKPVVIDKKLSAKKFGRKMLFGRDG